MSKKDYVLLARHIQESRHRFKSNLAHAMFAAELADDLKADNPRFDCVRFMHACMPAFMVGTNKANHWERITRNLQTTPK